MANKEMLRKKHHLRDKKIDILELTTEKDEYGDLIENWDPIAKNIWAYYRQASSSELNTSLSVERKVEVIFEIAWRDDIDTKNRIAFRGNQYKITRVDDYEGYKRPLRIEAYTIDGEMVDYD